MSVSLPPDILDKYKGDINIFFETGTSEGDSSQTALDCGFQRVFTVESHVPTAQRSIQRFANDRRVTVFTGDSVKMLELHLAYIHEPVLFWLDAHPSCDYGCTPLMEELKIILKRDYDDVILADDMRLMGYQRWAPITKDKLIRQILDAKLDYEVKFEGNGHHPADILVAKRVDK